MDPLDVSAIAAAEVVVPCPALDEALAWFVERLGFRIDAVFPADAPTVAVVSGHGVRLRLVRAAAAGELVLRLRLAGRATPRTLEGPAGMRVELVADDPPPSLPPLRPSLTVTRLADDAAFGVGRAGMCYRDLVPDRQGGRFIASHIRIPEGGPVPDWVHHHRIRVQLIYCWRGWVRVVYEDQGPPFVLEPGDCVLQPPGIRHRVLEASPGLEVIELSSPAEHETLADHELPLPNARIDPRRSFGSQRFVRHCARDARTGPWRLPGFEARDLGIGEATEGLAGARVVRSVGHPASPRLVHEGELCFAFVLGGTAALHIEGRPPQPLAAGDAFVVPAGLAHATTPTADDFELLEVTLPADLPTRPATDQ